MSLYVFNVTPHTAVVTADTRQCSTVGGVIYRLNDTTQKLHIIDDTIITIGGVEWICSYIVNKWKDGQDHSVDKLHRITLETLPHIPAIASTYGVGHVDYLSNPYMLEFCVLQFDKKLGYNVFYHIATSTGYQLERFDVDGIIHPWAHMFGGIDYEVVQDYFDAHPGQVKLDYLDAVHAAYELAVSEKIGGTLMIANQNKGQITMSQRKLKDNRPLRDVNALFASGMNVVGQNLNISCPDVNGGVNKFQMDSMGFFMYNGRYYMAGDGDAGRIGMDSHWGIFGGPKTLFDVTDTGYVKPSFVGSDGKMILDKDGFPKDTDFLLGMNGNHYFRGKIYATDGVFNGTVFAKDGEFTGKLKATVLDGKLVGGTNGGEIEGVSLNIGKGKYTVNKAGDVTMAGSINMDKGKITWGNNIPNKQRFAASTSGPWHDIMQSGDIYCCTWNYTTETWNPPYKIVGTDGKPGSDATVPKYITETVISKGVIEAPQINANNFSIYPQDGTTVGGSFNLYGNYNGKLNNFLKIAYCTPDGPNIQFYSPYGAYANWDFPHTTFTGVVDLSQADVRGVVAKFV